MSLTTSFKYDIFISYAQVDDQPTSGMERGWISTLVKDMTVLLDQRCGRIGACRIWWDQGSLPHHGNITPEIEQALRDTGILLVIYSQGYLSSDWCSAEREHFLALTGGADPDGKRIFLVEKDRIDLARRPPSFGDMYSHRFWETRENSWRTLGIPSTKEDDAYSTAMDRLARELYGQMERLRDFPVEAPHEGTAPAPSVAADRSGTGLTEDTDAVFLAQVTEPAGLIYPDPHLGAEERIPLSQAAPDMTLTTPTSCAGKHPQGGEELSLTGIQVGLSISNSPNLTRLGMGPPHLRDAMLELTRYLLAQGACLAYGGDLLPGGFTEQLLELVWAYDSQKREDDLILSPERKADLASRRLANYVAWPIHLNYSQAILAQHHLKGVFKFIDPPDDLKLSEAQQADFALPDTPEHRYCWFRSLTAMREQMVADIDARVLLGGQIRGYAGGIPGLVEEVLLALRRSQPVFLLGGMGGCTRAIIDAIEGRRPRGLTAEYQAESEGYAEFLDYLKQRPDAVGIDYPAMVNELQQAGVAGLNNGLSEAENRDLFETPHIPVMVSLVLKGLTVCKKKVKVT